MPDDELRRCIGSARFGIEPHDAPINEFPAQPSQKDGLGRMCAEHWRTYTAGLAREAKARKAAEAATIEPGPEPAAEAAKSKRKGRPAAETAQEASTT